MARSKRSRAPRFVTPAAASPASISARPTSTAPSPPHARISAAALCLLAAALDVKPSAHAATASSTGTCQPTKQKTQ